MLGEEQNTFDVSCSMFFFFFLNSDLSGSCKLVHEPRLISLAHSYYLPLHPHT